MKQVGHDESDTVCGTPASQIANHLEPDDGIPDAAAASPDVKHLQSHQYRLTLHTAGRWNPGADQRASISKIIANRSTGGIGRVKPEVDVTETNWNDAKRSDDLNVG